MLILTIIIIFGNTFSLHFATKKRYIKLISSGDKIKLRI